jgi:ubiquinone/menaquinone biosynthesis C-methylase UbiE
VEYAAVEEDFYDEQTDAGRVGAFRAWYHSSRFERLTEFVESHYRPSMRVADLGCGNCRWNVNHRPVTGVDINEKMLAWAQRHGLLADYHICPGLVGSPLPDGQFDLVVCSETLEHLLNYKDVLAEARRILKDDGTLLVTVPYDIFLGPFFLLFNINCVYQGYVKKSLYHKYRCGHINHFTKSRLRQELVDAGFELDRLFVVNGLLLYAAARKAR